MKLWVYVSTREPEISSQNVWAQNAVMVPRPGTWLLLEGEKVLPLVAEAVSSRELLSAYVGAAEMPSDKPWLASEWHGSIVADPGLTSRLEALLPGWIGKYSEGVGVVVYSRDPDDIKRREKLRLQRLITLPEPSWMEIDLEEAQDDPAGWFGEFGREEIGGWVTLHSAAIRGNGRIGAVGNLAALGLELNRGESNLWDVRASGAIRVNAIGMGREQVTEEMTLFGDNAEKYDLGPLKESNASYCIALRIEAPVDPKVIIGSGTVFEQLGPGNAQNLAIAHEWHDTIDSGQIVSLVLPAWCINQDLSPPSGQSLRLTPLAFTGQSTDQQEVWKDIARRRASGGQR